MGMIMGMMDRVHIALSLRERAERPRSASLTGRSLKERRSGEGRLECRNVVSRALTRRVSPLAVAPALSRRARAYMRTIHYIIPTD